ncbi:hypothetical protein GCM10011416_18210 [Polaribacter pacificus]|uniref:HmuY protein n=1 Tax=Polaribacter pacificus TaxID=1775173 RepID=A0A917I0Y7_9FLAO|nr:HmuY family protein [Polaribacter pacificus]GGH00082.1 hypothetical protein GCM10011416_18210 [Polaribacter pacificus]
MRILKSIFSLILITITLVSCTKNEEDVAPVVASSATNIHAPVTTDYTVNPPTEAGEFAKFSLATGAVVSGDNWDIAFRGTSILVNGGTLIGLADEPNRTGVGALTMVTSTFDALTTAPDEASFAQDASGTYALPKGSGNGWYSYNPTNHLISPIAGKIIVIKTHDGHYAKVEIISYYKDADTSLDSGYYSFNYVYNPNANDKNLEL